MKKSLVALATLSLIGSAFADVDVSGGVKLYGVLDQSLQSQSLVNANTGTSYGYQGIFASAATSRFGVKAGRDLSDGIKGIAQAEIELAPDSATLLPSANRQAFVGLVSEKAGTLLMGTMETTAYEVWGMDVNGRVEYKPQVWRTLTSVSMQDRANNSLKYISPSFGGFNLHLMKNFAEKSDTTSAGDTGYTTTVGSANIHSEITSYGLKFKSDNLSAALVHDSTSYIFQAYKFAGLANAGVSTSNAAGTNTALIYGSSVSTTSAYSTATQRDILALSYDMNGTLFNYIYGKSYQSGGGSNTTGTLGIRKSFDNVTLALSFGQGSISSPTATATAVYAGSGNTSDTTLGAYYNFDKSTQAYMLISSSKSTVGLVDGSNTTSAFGARYNF